MKPTLMRLAYFPGCKIHFHLKSYGEAVEAVMKHLGVTLVRLPFNCCGNPARGKNLTASVMAAVRNIALAQAQGLDIFTPCKCCFGQLKHGIHWYETDPWIREQVDQALAEEGLVFEPQRPVSIRHFLDFLYHDLGPERLARLIKVPLGPGKIVLQQGCHALRPYSITRFDNPFAPKMFRELAILTGLGVLDWAKETECCGDPAAETNGDLAFRIRQDKLAHARRAGADYICTACTHCQIQYERGQYDRVQYEREKENKKNIRAMPFAVFLGAALGINKIDDN